MKNSFLIMLLASSTVFSIEKPSLWKQANQKLFGKYLITKARENNCPEVAGILKDLKNCYSYPFANIPTCAEIFVQDSEIADLIRGIYLTRKHSGPSCESNFENIISRLQSRLYSQKIFKKFTKTTPIRSYKQMTHLEIIEWFRKVIADEIIKNNAIKNNLNPFSLEELLQKAEAKITAARSALAAAAEKEATTD